MSETEPNPNDDGGSPSAWVDLSAYTPGDYQPGRGKFVQVLWYLVSVALFESGWFPIGRVKPAILRAFGARIGAGVVIKPNVRIKYPWRLTVGDHVWIGQEVWIDNLADVRVGSHVCVSQRAYLCTGSHDHQRRGFDLRIGEIALGDGCWVAAAVTVLGPARIGANALVAGGSVVGRDVEAGTIVAGVPARVVGPRRPPENAPA